MAAATKDTTKKKPGRPKKKVDEEVEAKEEEAKEVADEVDEAIEALEGESLEDIPVSITRTLTHPDSGESKSFTQHEMPYLTKLKFFRLMTGTIRLASESENQSIAEFLSDILNPAQKAIQEGVSKEEAENLTTSGFIETIMKLIELVPDFAEQMYLYALNIRPKDQEWAIEAFETLDDEEGFDILDAFIAQNGKAIKRFFVRHLRRVGQRINQVVGDGDTEQE